MRRPCRSVLSSPTAPGLLTWDVDRITRAAFILFIPSSQAPARLRGLSEKGHLLWVIHLDPAGRGGGTNGKCFSSQGYTPKSGAGRWSSGWTSVLIRALDQGLAQDRAWAPGPAGHSVHQGCLQASPQSPALEAPGKVLETIARVENGVLATYKHASLRFPLCGR